MQALGLLLVCVGWMAWIPVFTPGVDPLWGTACTAMGAVLMVMSTGGRLRDWLWGHAPRAEAWLPVLAVLSAQYAVLRWIEPLAANRHELPWLAPVVALLAKGVGFRTAHSDGAMVYFGTEEDVLPFLTNWEKVGLVMPLGLAVGCGVLGLLTDLPWRTRLGRLGIQLGVVAGHTVVRYVVLCVGLIEFSDARGMDEQERLGMFTGLGANFVTHLPLAWVLWRIGGGTRLISMKAVPVGGWGKPSAGMSLVVAGLALVGVGAGWKEHRSGPMRPGEVLWNDHHSGTWEPSRPLLDGNGFGSDHLYNASSLVEWLRYFMPIRVHVDGPVTRELLEGVSVFVLKTPTRRLTSEEIEVLTGWVEAGGGLLLIGDHTNLLGMGSYLNEIAGRFDIQFQFDGSNAYSSGYFSRYRPPMLGAHPVVDGLPEMRFLTSATLRYWGRAQPVMVARDVMSDPVDYSKPSFFGRLTVSPRNGFGLFPLAVERRHGRGRVLAFSESTTLSNFAAFQDGTAEFYLRVLTHLGRSGEGSTGVAVGLVGLGLGGLAAGLFLLRSLGGNRVLLAVLLALGPGWAAGQAIRKGHHRAVRNLPQPVRPIPRVGFLLGRDYGWDVPPAIGPIFIPPEFSFDSLYVVPQRIGAYPQLLESGGKFGTDWKAVLVINPSREPAEKDRTWLKRYLGGGGRVIVLEASASTGAHLPGWLGVSDGAVLTGEGALGTTPSAVGVPPPGAPTSAPARWSVWKAGGGTVVVMGSSWQFSRAGVGNVMAEPDAAQREAYRVLMELLGAGLEGIERRPL